MSTKTIGCVQHDCAECKAREAAPSTSPAEFEELRKEIQQANDSRDFYKRRVEALQDCQSTMRDPERTMACDIIANGGLLMGGSGSLAADRYAIPQSAPSTSLNKQVLEKFDELAATSTSPELKAFQEVTGCATAGGFKAALSAAAWTAPSTSPCHDFSNDEELVTLMESIGVKGGSYELAICRSVVSALKPPPSPSMPFVPWSKEAEMLESWAAPSTNSEKIGCVQHDCAECKAREEEPSTSSEMDALKAENEQLREALLSVARKAEMLKQECGDSPESPQAIRNGRYMHISYVARAAIKGGA